VGLKNIRDCMGSHNGSIPTTHTPPPSSFYNTFNMHVFLRFYCHEAKIADE
jgi:hypothetical protein